MSEALQNLFFFALVATWFGGTILRWIRYRQAQRAYLRRFPPVEGYPLEEYLGRNPWSPVDRAINELARQPQADPELEQLRRAMWHQLRYVILWMFGFPLLGVGIMAVVVILTLFFFGPPR